MVSARIPLNPSDMLILKDVVGWPESQASKAYSTLKPRKLVQRCNVNFEVKRTDSSMIEE